MNVNLNCRGNQNTLNFGAKWESPGCEKLMTKAQKAILDSIVESIGTKDDKFVAKVSNEWFISERDGGFSLFPISVASNVNGKLDSTPLEVRECSYFTDSAKEKYSAFTVLKKYFEQFLK